MSDLAKLVEAISSARTSVFRLEARQHYADDPQWQSYERGEAWQRNADLRAWTEIVSSARARGVTMQRVHVLTEPWTPYVRFEVEQHYPHNLAAGEDVRLVRAGRPWSVPDFWLIDDHRGWLMHYEDDGTLGVIVQATDRALSALRSWRDEALAASTPVATPA
ncbi:DUF6879 family protein [Actinomycetospora flava]|uniref:DUF6879 family protein n=1 Tax=Actinomycetospora flava TaxID=3129232 RepID=A0ABU8M0H6_9PSEU